MLKGTLTRLREYRAEDIPAVTAMRNNEEARADTTRGIITPVTENTVQKEFEAQNGPAAFQYMLEDLSGNLLGYCKFSNNFKDRNTTIAYEVKPEEQGKGYGSDSLALILNMVFLEMNMNKCSTIILSCNEAARHILEKAGFRVEAVLRDDVYRHGTYQDALMMGLLKEEYLLSQDNSGSAK